jgi:hypothetical protein
MYITCLTCKKNITGTGICVACEPERVSEALSSSLTDRANLSSYISVVEGVCDGLKTRQQELLQTIRNLALSVPASAINIAAFPASSACGTDDDRVAEVERERDAAVVRAMVAEVERDEARKRIQFLESEVRRYDDRHNESLTWYLRTQAELAAVNREIERWRHGAPIESDFVCPNELLLHQILGAKS